VVPTKNRKFNPNGDEFGTPEKVWKPWHEALNFVIDAAASKDNHLPGTIWWDKEMNSLKAPLGFWAQKAKEFGGAIWLNPPYSRVAGPLELWVAKAMLEAYHGCTICMLLPSDTSTMWFSALWDRSNYRWRPGVMGFFLEGRVRFIHPLTNKPTENSPNFGSLIVVLTRPLVME
jgi:phage N-6-adenine-methyltransferase